MYAAARPSSSSRAEKIASIACESCKKAKTKCDGKQPCQTCVTKKLECIYDISKDGRRGRKRTLDQLYSQADALTAILDSIKSSDNESVQKLIELVKDNAPLDELVTHTRLVLKENERRERSRNQVRRNVLNIATLIDVPLIRVPAKPWTSVAHSDSDVSHLISVYFTWQNHGYPSVDQDVFVRAMQSGSIESDFCSPLLVNAMLANACVYTDHPAAFADSEDPSTRGLHFMNEVVRLWSLEQDKLTLTNLQAWPASITASVSLGRDRTGLRYAYESVPFATEFTIQVKKGRKRGLEVYSTPEFKRSYSLALWAAFLVQTEVAIAWSRPLVLLKPTCGYPYLDTELAAPAIWSPYPRTDANLEPRVSYFPFVLTNARIKLYEIAAELRSVVLSGSPQDSPLPGHITLDRAARLEQLNDTHSKLLEWYNNLPQTARLTLDATVLPEPLIDLHLAYYAFKISIANHILRATRITEADQQKSTEIVISSSQIISDIFEHRSQTVSPLYYGIYTAHASVLSAYALLDYLGQPEVPDIFHTIMKALVATARRWTIPHGTIKMIWYEIQQRKLDHLIKDATRDLIEVSGVEKQTDNDRRIIEKIAYPNYAAVKERGFAFSEIGDLLEEYSNLESAKKEA